MEQKMITIPFDVERAKRIQAGEEPGKVVTIAGKNARVVCWDRKTEHKYKIVSLLDNGKFEVIAYNDKTGASDFLTERNLVLQIPEWTQCKKGDVVSCEIDNGDGDHQRWYGIVKKVDCTIEGDTNGYVEFVVIWNLEHRNGTDYVEQNYSTNYFDCINLATEEEKRRFIEELKKYAHNSDIKKILKEYFGIEEKPECKFEPFQKVLIRDNDSRWSADFFSHFDFEEEHNPFICVGGMANECIPYNEQTKHLLGTTDNWEE